MTPGAVRRPARPGGAVTRAWPRPSDRGTGLPKNKTFWPGLQGQGDQQHHWFLAAPRVQLVTRPVTVNGWAGPARIRSERSYCCCNLDFGFFTDYDCDCKQKHGPVNRTSGPTTSCRVVGLAQARPCRRLYVISGAGVTVQHVFWNGNRCVSSLKQ